MKLLVKHKASIHVICNVRPDSCSLSMTHLPSVLNEHLRTEWQRSARFGQSCSQGVPCRQTAPRGRHICEIEPERLFHRHRSSSRGDRRSNRFKMAHYDTIMLAVEVDISMNEECEDTRSLVCAKRAFFHSLAGARLLCDIWDLLCEVN